MALLSLSNVNKNFGEKEIFKDVSFSIEENHKIGFVGINGSGKTTLFKVICDNLDYDSGDIYKSKALKIGYVEQFVLKDSINNVFDELISIRQELLDIENKIESLQYRIENNKEDIEKLIHEKSKLEEEYRENDGYVYKSIAKSTLLGLGFKEEELSLNVSKLSGGQKTKLTLAKLLFSNSNLLLLDEPTNNLDISSIEWLENFLINFKGSFIVISHDRYFLDKVTFETLELENKRVSLYKGSYTKYLELKAEKNKMLSKKYEQDLKEIKRIEGIIEQQKRWNQERNYVTIRSKQHSIDRIEENLEKPDSENEKMNFHFKVASGGNREVLKVNNLSKSFGDNLIFENVNIDVFKGERVFIVGNNGCGKTTLLNIILGNLKQTSGDYLVGNNMKIAYYSQNKDDINSDKTVLDYVWEKHQDLTQTEIRKALAVFLFKGEDVFKQISDLSGGEKARVSLLMIMLSTSNFLILDEPTNHLDILSREALEDALLDYEGTMLIVSHDRYFINKLANKIIRIDKEGSKEFKGNYDFYISNYIAPESIKVVKEKNLSYKEKKEEEARRRKIDNRIKKLEELINANDLKIAELNNLALTDEYGSDVQKAQELMNEILNLQAENEKYMSEWEELNLKF